MPPSPVKWTSRLSIDLSGVVVTEQGGTARTSGKPHTVDLVLRNGSALVRLGGDIDLVSAHDLNRVLESLDRLSSARIEVDLAEVRFVDSHGLLPLIEATRRRRDACLPPVLIGRPSRAVLRLLAAAGVDADPVLDVDAWDRLARTC